MQVKIDCQGSERRVRRAVEGMKGVQAPQSYGRRIRGPRKGMRATGVLSCNHVQKRKHTQISL